MIKTAAAGETTHVELLATSVPREESSTARRLTRLFHEHLDLVWRTSRRFGLSPTEADDAAQHVFLVASKKLAEIAPERERSFLVAAAINVAKTMLRSRARRREDLAEGPDVTDDKPTPEEHLERARAREEVHRILAEMDEDMRVAFMLFELEEMTMSEVAELLGVPPGTVASRVRRARDFFRARANRGSA